MERIPVLMSYAYIKEDVIELLADPEVHKYFDILIDSGAYTTFKSGKSIDIDKYINFIDNLPFPVTGYFTLDSIGNPELTRKNYDLIRREGLDPIPVFTRRDKPKDFEYYYETAGYVGIGGIAGTQGCRDHLINLYESGLLTNKKVHWLGFIQHDFLLHYKPFSCDTTSWLKGMRFACGWYYANRRYRTFTKSNFKDHELKVFCARYGFDSYILGKESSWRRLNSISPFCQVLQFYAAYEYLLMLKKRVGVKLYLSISDYTINVHLRMMLENYNNFWRNYNEQ